MATARPNDRHKIREDPAKGNGMDANSFCKCCLIQPSAIQSKADSVAGAVVLYKKGLVSFNKKNNKKKQTPDLVQTDCANILAIATCSLVRILFAYG